MKVMKKTSKIAQNTSVQATKTRHFLTADQNRENYDSKVVQVVLARLHRLLLRLDLHLHRFLLLFGFAHAPRQLAKAAARTRCRWQTRILCILEFDFKAQI